MKTPAFLLFTMLASVVALDAAKASPTPYPALGAERRVYVAGVPDVYASLRPLVRSLEAESELSYYVVVIESSGSGPNATRRYVDELHARWRTAAEATSTLTLDPEQALIFVLALTNRQLAVHPGVALQSALGLRAGTIDKELVEPHFIRYAKSGEYLAGLENLLRETNGWVRARRAQLESETATRTQREADRRRFVSRTLPLIAIGAGLTLVLGMLGLLTMRHARARRDARGRLDAFRTEVVRFLDKLEALKRRQELLPFTDQDYGGQLAGETLAFYEEIERSREELRERWLAHMETCREVERLINDVAWPRARRYREAIQRLSAKDSGFGSTESGYARCVESLDRLERAHEETEAVLVEFEGRLDRLSEQTKAVEAAELSTAPYEDGTAACRDALTTAKDGRTSDPLGATQVLAAAGESLTELGRWTEDVLRLVDQIQQLREEIERAATRIEERRSGGWKLEEEGGNPDVPLARARERDAAAWLALDRGDDDEAGEGIANANTDVERAREILARQENARELCESGIPAARKETESLEGALPAAKEHREELAREFSPMSWRSVAENVGRVEAILDEIAPVLEDAAASADTKTQRYFHAVDRLGHVQMRQAEARERLAALADRRRELLELREDCRARVTALPARQGKARDALKEHAAVVGADTVELEALLANLAREITSRAAITKPDWIRLHEEIASVEDGLRAVVSDAEEDARLHRELGDKLQTARRRADEIQRMLGSSDADRRPANQRFRDGRDDLDQIASRRDATGADWSILHARLDDAVQDLEAAAALARTDMQLARQVGEALDDAEREVRRAASYSRVGATADVSAPRAELRDARARYDAQDYEAALRLASGAKRSARDAYDEAVAEARRRQRRRDRERRQRDAQARAAAALVYAALSSSWRRRSSSSRGGASTLGSSSSFGRRASVPRSRPSSSSSSSWSSSSSQSSW